MFTERLSGEAERLGLRVIEVDTALTEDGLAERVTEALELQMRLCPPGAGRYGAAG